MRWPKPGARASDLAAADLAAAGLAENAAGAPYAQIAASVQRAISLLSGGVSAPRVRAGLFDGDGVTGPEWRVLGVAWQLAEQSGAPILAMLERFAEALRSLTRVAERRSVLLSAPRATIRLVAVLPPVALLLSALLGFDPLTALAGPAGRIAAIAGIALLCIGVKWADKLARRVEEADWVAGWEFELMVIALGGGAPPHTALLRVVDCADAARAEWVRLEQLGPEGAVPRAIVEAARLGVALGPLLLAEAETQRRRTHADLESAAERLGVRVLVPLALCVLPSFVLLGVVPVFVAVVSGAGL